MAQLETIFIDISAMTLLLYFYVQFSVVLNSLKQAFLLFKIYSLQKWMPKFGVKSLPL